MAALLPLNSPEQVNGFSDSFTGWGLCLNMLHQNYASMDVSEKVVWQLHKLTRGQVWDAGQYNGDVECVGYGPGVQWRITL